MLDRDKNQKGFTLIELIVVLAVASVLTAVFVPQFYHYVGNSKTSSCRQARENLLAIFERKVYAGEYNINEINTFLTSTEFEVTDNTCPESGIYEGEVTGNRVSIKCKFPEHKDDLVFADIEGFNGTETTEGEDNSIPIPTLPPIVTPSVTEAVPTEGEPVSPVPTWEGLWPYTQDYIDAGKDYIDIIPTGVFTSKAGTLVIVYKEYKNMWIGNAKNGPEYIINLGGWGFVLSPTGVYRKLPTDGSKQIHPINRGDIVVYNGDEYVFVDGGTYGSINLNTNQWYKIPKN